VRRFFLLKKRPSTLPSSFTFLLSLSNIPNPDRSCGFMMKPQVALSYTVIDQNCLAGVSLGIRMR
jgi:hypothetical protein